MAPDEIRLLSASLAETNERLARIEAMLQERCVSRGYEIRDIKVEQRAHDERIKVLEDDASRAKGMGGVLQYIVSILISAGVALGVSWVRGK